MIKLSHSGKNKYQVCPASYKFRYVDKLVPRLKGSPLYFGSAIDNALNYMLENKDQSGVVEKSMSIFDAEWTRQKDNKYDLVDLPKCEDISYYKSDFDPLLLSEKDWTRLPKRILEIRSKIEERKKLYGWYGLRSRERQWYNYSTWLSLKNKGHHFIKAYYEQIVPKIKRTVAVQLELELPGGEHGKMTGFIDAVVELQDGRIAVLDNKTSSMIYAEESVANSEQLALYMSILNIHAADEPHSWKTPIDCCAYAVLSKKLVKHTTKICQTCGHSGNGSHAKCDNKVGKTRCNGEWTKTYKFTVSTQFIVDNIPETLQDQVLTNSENVIENIVQGHFPQDFGACQGQYGLCEYYKLCHEGLLDDLIDIKGKKKDA